MAVINSNISSMKTIRSLQRANERIQGGSSRLASGSRIERAASDAAGLGSAERMDARGRATRQAQRNVQDGISLFQTMDGAIGELLEIFHRQRELAIQSASGTLSDESRVFANSEYQALEEEMLRIRLKSLDEPLEERGIDDPSNQPLTIVVGDESDGSSSLMFELVDLGFWPDATFLFGVDTQANAQQDLAVLQERVQMASSARAHLGAWQVRLGTAGRNLDSMLQSITAAHSRVTDADFGLETAEIARAQLVQQTSSAVFAQANALPSSVLRLIG
jgi:flagellin